MSPNYDNLIYSGCKTILIFVVQLFACKQICFMTESAKGQNNIFCNSINSFLIDISISNLILNELETLPCAVGLVHVTFLFSNKALLLWSYLMLDCRCLESDFVRTKLKQHFAELNGLQFYRRSFVIWDLLTTIRKK